MAKKPRTLSQKLANPAWRATLPDSALTPTQRVARTQARARKRRGNVTDPLAPTTSFTDMTNQANQLVDAQQSGDVTDLDQRTTRENQQFATRAGLAQGQAQYQSADLAGAFTNTQNALNQILATSNAAGAQDQATLAASLKAADDARAKMYASLGIAPPATPVDPNAPQTSQLLTGAAANEAGILGNATSDATAQIAAAGERRAIPGQQLALSLRDIGGEHTANLNEIQTGRDALKKNRPALLRQALQDLQSFEIAKRQYGDQHANQLFQQFLAEKQLGDSEQNQTFQQWLATQQLNISQQQADDQSRVTGATITGTDPKTGRPTFDYRKWLDQSNIDWANVGINQQQATAQIAAIAAQANDADDKKKSDAAAKRGEGIAKGIEWLSGFMGEAPPGTNSKYPFAPAVPSAGAISDDPSTPQNEGKPAVKGSPTYRKLFDDALRGMTQYMSRSDALRILTKSNYSDWRAKANYLLQRAKRRGRSGPVQPGRPTPADPKFGGH